MNLLLIICCFWLQTRLAWTAGSRLSATAPSRYTSSNTRMHEHTRRDHLHLLPPVAVHLPLNRLHLQLIACWFYWLPHGLNCDKQQMYIFYYQRKHQNQKKERLNLDEDTFKCAFKCIFFPFALTKQSPSFGIFFEPKENKDGPDFDCMGDSNCP